MKENTMSITRAQLREMILKEASFDPDLWDKQDELDPADMNMFDAVTADEDSLRDALQMQAAAEIEELERGPYDYEMATESTIMTVGQFRKLIREVGMPDLPGTIEHAANQLHHVEAMVDALEDGDLKNTLINALNNAGFNLDIIRDIENDARNANNNALESKIEKAINKLIK